MILFGLLLHLLGSAFFLILDVYLYCIFEGKTSNCWMLFSKMMERINTLIILVITWGVISSVKCHLLKWEGSVARLTCAALLEWCGTSSEPGQLEYGFWWTPHCLLLKQRLSVVLYCGQVNFLLLLIWSQCKRCVRISCDIPDVLVSVDCGMWAIRGNSNVDSTYYWEEFKYLLLETMLKKLMSSGFLLVSSA